MTEASTTQTTTGETTSTTSPGSTTDTDAAAAPFYESFTREELKTNPSIQKYKSVEDLASAYTSLEKRYGIEPDRRVDLPKDMADKEAMKAVWKRLGAPDKPEDYGFKPGEGASEADMALVSDFAKTATELGVPKEHAGGMMSWFQGKVAEAAARQAAEFEAQRAAGETTLRKEWGEAYDARGKEIGRLLAEHNDPELTAALDGKMGNYPGLMRFLGKMLDRMAEPGAAGGAAGDAAALSRPLTPAQAKGEARKIETHPGFLDRNHPEHKALVARRSELLRSA